MGQLSLAIAQFGLHAASNCPMAGDWLEEQGFPVAGAAVRDCLFMPIDGGSNGNGNGNGYGYGYGGGSGGDGDQS